MSQLFRLSRYINKRVSYNYGRCFYSQDLSKFSGIGRLNHVAIACSDLAATSSMYRDVLNAKVSEPEDLPEHGVTTVFVEVGNTKIELLHPLGESSPIQGYLNKNPSGGLHHICLEVEDINEAVQQLKENGKRVLNEPKTGAHGLPVVFVHPKDMGGVLVELEEIKK
eukprot:618565_1